MKCLSEPEPGRPQGPPLRLAKVFTVVELTELGLLALTTVKLRYARNDNDGYLS